jgi:hypothetical protein
MNWLNDILECTKESEAPERYFWWSAISSISAVVRRRIYLDRHYYKLYPNVYIILVGPSGLRKSVPITLAEKLVSVINCTRVLNGRASIQAVIKELGKAYTCEDKSLITDATGFLISPELDTMLIKDDQVPTILMDLYDTHTKERWKNVLVGKDNKGDTLKNVYLTLLGASNETNLISAMPRTATEGGLIARTSIILEEKKRLINSLITKPDSVPNIQALSKRLFEVSNLEGKFIFDNGIDIKFDKWYKSFMTLESMDRTGTLDRLPDTILKVAMNISLASKDDLVITLPDLDEAIWKCQETIVGMRKVFLGSGEHSLAKPTAHVLRILVSKKEHKISRMRLLQSLYGEADAIDLDRIIDTFKQSGIIDVENVGGEVWYSLKEEVINQYQSILKQTEV